VVPPVESIQPGTSDADLARARRVGVGCFSTFVGFWSGGMIGVLVGKFVGNARRCVPIEGTPACDWYYFAAAGMILGAVTLPVLVLRRLSRKPRT
jgi:hypothetical protein